MKKAGQICKICVLYVLVETNLPFLLAKLPLRFGTVIFFNVKKYGENTFQIVLYTGTNPPKTYFHNFCDKYNATRSNKHLYI